MCVMAVQMGCSVFRRLKVYVLLFLYFFSRFEDFIIKIMKILQKNVRKMAWGKMWQHIMINYERFATFLWSIF